MDLARLGGSISRCDSEQAVRAREMSQFQTPFLLGLDDFGGAIIGFGA